MEILLKDKTEEEKVLIKNIFLELLFLMNSKHLKKTELDNILKEEVFIGVLQLELTKFMEL